MSGIGPQETAAIVEAVRRVSKGEIVPRFRSLGTGDVDTKSHADDLVTVADKAAERALGAEIAAILPGARIVGEEAVSDDRGLLLGLRDAGLSVIVDPIDGTWNYANGVSIYGVILAVVDHGETVMGLLYDPTGDDWIVALKGEGAWYVRPGAAPRRLRAASPASGLSDAYGFVGLYLYPKPEQALIAATLPKFRRTNSLRCSCHEYRMLTEGRAHFALNGMLNPWDHAAGVLALREAGGVARLIDGTEYSPTMTEGRLLVAGSDALWHALADLYAVLAR